jgi:Domain of unknown function (DUF4136)
MKKLTYLAAALGMLWCLSACTSYNYYTAAINKTNMSGYHTFAWMPPAKSGDAKIAGSMADVSIKDAATTALVSKGLQVSQNHPDLIINYRRIVGTGSYTTYSSPGWGYPGWGFGWGWGYRPYYAFGGPFSYYGDVTFAESGHYKEGTVIIDLIDPQTRRIVWRGFGVGEVHHNPQKDVEDLPKVVTGILDQLHEMPAPPMRMKQS